VRLWVVSVNCWPEDIGGGKMNVNVEYTLQPQKPAIDLSNVVISIPLGTTASPEIVSCDGATTYNAKAHTLEWKLDYVSDSNSSGVLEFNIAGKSSDAFFPVNVAFQSSSTLCDMDVSVMLSDVMVT
jgi:Adaptor complexes medium subunit family